MSKEKEKKSPELPEILKPLADVVKPLADIERSAFELVKAPFEAAGMPPPPEPPLLATVITRVAEGKPPLEIPKLPGTEKEEEKSEETPAAKGEKRKGKSKWGY